MPGEIRKALASLGGMATLGISCGVCVAIGIFLGLSLDEHFGFSSIWSFCWNYFWNHGSGKAVMGSNWQKSEAV